MKGACYYFVHASGRWERLSRDLGEALRKWGELMQAHFSAETMKDIFDRYEVEIIPQKAPRTQRDNRAELKKLRPVFNNATPAAITAQHIYRYLDQRTAKIRANREIALLSDVFNKAIRWGAVTENPCKGVEKNKETPRDRDVLETEYQAVYSLATPLYQIAMDIARITGLREGNIRLLMISDIQEQGLRVTLNKRGKRVIFEWTPGLREVISRARALRDRVDSLYLLTSRKGTPYTEDGFRTGWHRLMKKALALGQLKERFHFHDLRALAASESATPAALLGHSNPRITESVYLRKPRRITPNK